MVARLKILPPYNRFLLHPFSCAGYALIPKSDCQKKAVRVMLFILIAFIAAYAESC